MLSREPVSVLCRLRCAPFSSDVNVRTAFGCAGAARYISSRNWTRSPSMVILPSLYRSPNLMCGSFARPSSERAVRHVERVERTGTGDVVMRSPVHKTNSTGGLPTMRSTRASILPSKELPAAGGGEAAGGSGLATRTIRGGRDLFLQSTHRKSPGLAGPF